MPLFSSPTDFVIPAAFVLLLIWTLASGGLAALLAKSRDDWLLDVSGLFVQGTLVPLCQITLLYWLYQALLPELQGGLKIGFGLAFVLNFVLVDYLYYWNHRWLHRPSLWPIHQVHHTMTTMDVLGTSRNTLWSSAFIVYVWVNSMMIYLLAEPAGYVLGAALTAALDLWRHSTLDVRSTNPLRRLLASLLIFPRDHALHHSRERFEGNYGSNLKIWDQLHGTWRAAPDEVQELGLEGPSLSLVRKLLWPFP